MYVASASIPHQNPDWNPDQILIKSTDPERMSSHIHSKFLTKSWWKPHWIQFKSRWIPDHFHFKSRSNADHIQITFKSHPDQIQIKFRSNSDQIQVKSRSNPDQIHNTSRSNPDHIQITSRPNPNQIQIEPWMLQSLLYFYLLDCSFFSNLFKILKSNRIYRWPMQNLSF